MGMIGVCLFAAVAMWPYVLAQIDAVFGLRVVGVVMCLGGGVWVAVVCAWLLRFVLWLQDSGGGAGCCWWVCARVFAW